MVLEGYAYREIQKILEVSANSTSKWNKAFKCGGLETPKSRYQEAIGDIFREVFP